MLFQSVGFELGPFGHTGHQTTASNLLENIVYLNVFWSADSGIEVFLNDDADSFDSLNWLIIFFLIDFFDDWWDEIWSRTLLLRAEILSRYNRFNRTDTLILPLTIGHCWTLHRNMHSEVWCHYLAKIEVTIGLWAISGFFFFPFCLFNYSWQ